jgi:hypothetical protein
MANLHTICAGYPKRCKVPPLSFQNGNEASRLGIYVSSSPPNRASIGANGESGEPMAIRDSDTAIY